MSLNHLTQADIKIIGECLKAAYSGPFLPEGQFFDEAVLGFNLDDLLDVSSKWPHVTVDNKINGVVNNVLAAFIPDGYPLSKLEDWDKWVSTSPEIIDEILQKWRRLDFPLTEKEALEIASMYAYKNVIDKAKYTIEKKYFTDFQIRLVQNKSWGWVFRLELAPAYPSVVVIVNRFNGSHFAFQADDAEGAIDSYEKSLSTWETSFAD